MSVGGWITLILSVGTVTGLFSWCVWMVFRTSDYTRSLRDVEIRHRGAPDED